MRSVRTTTVRTLAKVSWMLTVLGAAALLPAGESDPRRWAGEIGRFEEWDGKNSTPEDAVLFLGSSSIRMWATSDYFPYLPVINRGFGGAHISDVLHYLERIVTPYRPRVIVFYAGDNDIAAGKPPQRVAADYRSFVKHVHQELPETRIIFIPIKPSLKRWTFWPRMKEANAAIRHFTEQDRRLLFADTVTSALGDDGKPRPELFIKDGLHLSAEGYRLWAEALIPVIDGALQTEL